jgi:hypothetical protein
LGKLNHHSFTKAEANKLNKPKIQDITKPFGSRILSLLFTLIEGAFLNYKPTHSHGAGTPTYHSSKSSKNTGDTSFNGEPALKFMRYNYTKCNTIIYFS